MTDPPWWTFVPAVLALVAALTVLAIWLVAITMCPHVKRERRLRRSAGGRPDEVGQAVPGGGVDQ